MGIVTTQEVKQPKSTITHGPTDAGRAKDKNPGREPQPIEPRTKTLKHEGAKLGDVRSVPTDKTSTNVLLASALPTSPIVATAAVKSGQSPPPPDQTAEQVLGRMLAVVVPDAIVLTSNLGQLPTDRRFYLQSVSDPSVGTLFIGQRQPLAAFNLGGQSFRINGVEGRHFKFGSEVSRELGVGSAVQVGPTGNRATLFLNFRGGDTNNILNWDGKSKLTVSVNGGFFCPLSAVQPLVDKLPKNPVKTALTAALTAARVSGAEVGLAWRGNLTLDPKSGKALLNISGQTFDVTEWFSPKNQDSEVIDLNQGFSPVQKLNNDSDYTRGANPFEQLTSTAGRTHGDPIAEIASGVLKLQKDLGVDTKQARTNDEARVVVEEAIKRTSNESPLLQKLARSEGRTLPVLADDPKAELNALLVRLGRNGVFFGSPTIKDKALQAAEAEGDKTRFGRAPTTTEADFAQKVFEGVFRRSYIDKSDPAGTAFDLLTLGTRPLVAVVRSILEPSPEDMENTGDQLAAKRRVVDQGFDRRLDLNVGSASKAFGLHTPVGTNPKEFESAFRGHLRVELDKRLKKKEVVPSAEALYREFKTLAPAEKNTIAERFEPDYEYFQDRRVWGSREITNTTKLGRVEARSPNRLLLHGELVRGHVRTKEPSEVYALQGDDARGDATYLLLDRSGRPITSATAAREEALRLIKDGSATRLSTRGSLSELFDLGRSLASSVSQGASTVTRGLPSVGKRFNDAAESLRQAPNVHKIDARVSVVGKPTLVMPVGAINQTTSQRLQGEVWWGRLAVMSGKTAQGTTIFYLKGAGTNYPLRNELTDELITNQGEAIKRAREIISKGDANDLRQLPKKYLP